MQSFHSAAPTRGILFLADPFGNGKWMEEVQKNCKDTTALVFTENERCFYRSRSALWEMRGHFGWICVAGEGNTAGLALALAAQLPVDRIALRHSTLFSRERMRRQPTKLERGLTRIGAFARRNLSLVVSEILMLDSEERELRSLVRGLGHSRRLCSLYTQTSGTEEENWQELLLQPWQDDRENRLRIPWKCV